MIIVKIGGSVFSDKGGEEENIRTDVVRRIAGEIREFYPGRSFLIVHGGGSFGHPLAKRYGIRDGLVGDLQEKRIGFSKTHQAMLRANSLIVDAFLDEGLPAFSVSTSSVFTSRNGRVASGSIHVIRRLLQLGLIPVLFGDVVIDEEKGIDVLSGDQIMTYLTEELRPEKVIFLMDVDGIYDGKPGEGRLIDELKEDDVERLLERLRCTSGTDVTGGICNKLREALRMVRFSEVWFVNGLVGGRLKGAIKGKTTTRGTRLIRASL
ncbi:MAG: isopentenyl phosphate kinase family protein [Thermococci archaeon]|nr:isopentenyl phosphate kinase family protein [Thermococci archaeon]